MTLLQNRETPEETRARIASEEKAAKKETSEQWNAFKLDEREKNYRATIGKFIESLADDGRISAQYRAKPKPKELLAGQALAQNGHKVEYLSETGDGKHPDCRVDGIVADFKRIESENSDKVYQRIQEAVSKADLAIIDLSLRTVSIDAAIAKAEKAIETGITQPGQVIILDWLGREYLV